MRQTPNLPHARVYRHWLKTDAWKALDGRSVRLLVHLLARWRPGAPGTIPFTDANAARVVNAHSDTAAKSVDTLRRLGFLSLHRQGGLRGPRCARTRMIELVTYPAGRHLAPPYSRMPFGRIPEHWLALPAWRLLSPPATKLLVDTLARHDDDGENLWKLDAKAVVSRAGCGRVTAYRVLSELDRVGWFCQDSASGCGAGVYSLSQFPTPYRPAEAWRYERWIPPLKFAARKFGTERPTN